MTERKSFYLVDAANILFRAYHAIGPMSNKEGVATGALFGFIRTILKLIESLKPDYMACVFDGPNNKKQRQEIYEHYKAHRKKMPEDLIPQLKHALEFCKFKGLCAYNIEGVEADDTIGSIVKWASQNLDVFICSSDKDLCQLVNEHVKVVHLHKDNLIVDQDKVMELYGVKPLQIVDLLALMGDTSDNIPGVEGIGPKTASEWIKKYGSIEGLYQNLSQLPEKKRLLLQSSHDIVMMSQKLAQIITDVPFNQNLSSFAIKPEETNSLKELYQSMQFYSLLKGVTSPPPLRALNAKLVLNLEDLQTLIKEQKQAQIHILHPITEAQNPLDKKIVGLCLGTEHEQIAYIPLGHQLSQNEIIKELHALKDLAWTGHNLKDTLHLMNLLGFTPHVAFDTMIAAYLIEPNKNSYSLDLLALEYLGLQKSPSLSGKGKTFKALETIEPVEMASFVAEEVFLILKLKDHLEKKLKERCLESVYYNIEIPLIPVLARMETYGIYVDQADLEKLGIKFTNILSSLEASIFAQAGQSFNISSPKQLSHILFDVLKIKPGKKTQTGFSTSADVLESLQDQVPFVKQVLEYRTYEKLRTTYTESLIQQINPKTHRIHCTFNQTVAATGRLSSQDPNLQNIPVKTEQGRLIRSSFKPQNPGYSFLSLDYSQIELRLLAHLSEDPILVEAFNHHQDIHTRTASEVFGVRLSEVTPQMRQKAKAVNFGILYGQQAFGLSQGLDLSFAEAKEFIEKYFQTYKRVKDYLESQKELARECGYSLTLTGRRRPIPDINAKNPMIRQAAERLATNTPLQGTAADLIKMAMLSIDHKIYNRPTPLGLLLLQIHDELLFEVKDESIQELAALAKKEMEGVLKLKVPLIVDISVGKNWGEC